MDLMINWLGGNADLALSGADLAIEDGLKSAVITSLFTDARCSKDELPEWETDRRGWWGDGLDDLDGKKVRRGSKLWLLAREKQTEATRQRAQDYASEALAWLVEEGAAEAVSVTAQWAGRSLLSLLVRITLPDGADWTDTFETKAGG